VGGLALEGGEDEHLEMPAEFVAVDGGMRIILDRLYIYAQVIVSDRSAFLELLTAEIRLTSASL
jgi:hypothetical protein